ncbi:hypothetical protein Emag_004319 [Eimeria magna]
MEGPPGGFPLGVGAAPATPLGVWTAEDATAAAAAAAAGAAGVTGELPGDDDPGSFLVFALAWLLTAAAARLVLLRQQRRVQRERLPVAKGGKNFSESFGAHFATVRAIAAAAATMAGAAMLAELASSRAPRAPDAASPYLQPQQRQRQQQMLLPSRLLNAVGAETGLLASCASPRDSAAVVRRLRLAAVAESEPGLTRLGSRAKLTKFAEGRRVGLDGVLRALWIRGSTPPAVAKARTAKGLLGLGGCKHWLGAFGGAADAVATAAAADLVLLASAVVGASPGGGSLWLFKTRLLSRFGGPLVPLRAKGLHNG